MTVKTFRIVEDNCFFRDSAQNYVENVTRNVIGKEQSLMGEGSRMVNIRYYFDDVKRSDPILEFLIEIST